MVHPPRLLRAILILGFLLLSLISTSAKTCNLGCHNGQYAKAYQEGHTYIYRLEGTSVSSVTDAKDDTTLNLKAIVELTAKPDCVLQLKLKDVNLNDAAASLPDLQKYALQFSYHDGHIDSDVCAEPDDSQTSLNIKRAVVSLFQSAVRLDSGSTVHLETDVFGSCSTDFTFQKEGDSLFVQKYKDLSQCSYREKIGQGLVTSVFDKSSGIKSTPLLVSQQKIEQRFKQGILNKASSTETYKFEPFSNGDAGAKTVIETTLTFKGEKNDNPSAPVSLSKSIIFEAPHPVVKSSADAISNALKAVSKEKSGDVVREKTAEKFAELIKILRVSNKKDILSVYHKVTAGAGFNKVSDKKILLDALFRTGSGEAAEVAVELIKNRELSNLQSNVFYANLPLIRHVNLPAVTAVASLLNQEDLSRIGYLGIGQTIGKYCQEHPCDNVPIVKDAIHKIREKVGNGKTKTRVQENQIISGLKALRNSKYLDDATLQKLSNIATDKQVSNRVRVAAIEALSTTCSMKWKNPIINVLNDHDEDSEIRIKVYLALVNCACPHVASKIEEMLNKETVNQVGSFITSHLRNLRASTDPNKKAAQKFLGHIKPHTKFPEDFRKFSFNNELSYNLEALGIGSSVESNVIYSQNSFIPRSTSLNLTAEVFGQSFNFLELDTRIENLDRVIEHYFGPKGQFREHSVDVKSANEAADNAKEIKSYIYQRLEQLKRNKREVKQGELDKFAKNVHLRNTEVDEDLNVDLSVKLFGVELAYLSYQDNPEKFTPQNLIDKIFDNFKTGFDLVKDFDYNFQNNLHFLDADLIYPTGLGIPLSLGVTGTSIVNIKAKGKLDIASILKDPNNAAVRIALEPSASIRITGSMILEALDRKSGVVIAGNLVTDTASDMSIKIIDGTGFDVNFGIPKKKQRLISVSSEVLFTSGPKGEKLVPLKFDKGKEYSDCFEQLSSLLGLIVCGHIKFPYSNIESIKNKPLYPLSGPTKFDLTIENDDVKNYYFKIYYNKKVPNARGLEILFETPNSKTNRHISLLIESGLEPDRYFKADLNLPIKKASLLAVIKNKPEEKTLSLTGQNDFNEYFFRAGIIANGNKYKPILEYKVPEHIEKLSGTKVEVKGDQLYKIDGIVNVDNYGDGKKYTLENVAIIGGNKKIVSLNGFAISTTNKAIVDVKLNYGDESLTLKLDGNKLEERNYVVKLSAMPSKDPNIGFNVQWEYNKQLRNLDHKFIFIHGADPNSQTNRFTLEQHIEYNLNSVDFLLSTSQKITYPAMNALLEMEGKITNSLIEGDFNVKYEKFKLGTELSLKTDMVKSGDYEFELEVELMQNKIELKSKRTVIEIKKKSKFQNSLELSPGGKYEANGEITYEINKNLLILQVNGDLNLNGKVVTADTALEVKSDNVHSHAVISMDANKYLDFTLKHHYGLNPNGNLNLNVKNYLIVVGEYHYNNGKGNGYITIDVPKYNRKIKAHGDLTISGSQHTANVELLYDVDKDPNKRIKLSTVSDITNTSVDTKNILEVLSYKLELNVKGDLKGTLKNGELTINADTTLPSGRHIVVSGKRVSVKKENQYDVNVHSEFIDYLKKGGQSQKFIFNGDLKDFNLDKITFKTHIQSTYVSFDGRDLVYELVLNHIEDTSKKNIELDLKYSGSFLYKPFAFGINSDYSKNDATYKIKSSLGNDFDLNINGNYIGGNYINNLGTPFKSVFNGEVKLPFEKLQNIKLYLSNNLLLNPNNNLFEYSSVQELTYNSNKNIKMDINVKYKGDSNSNEGGGKIKLIVLEFPTIIIENSFNNVISDNIKKYSSSTKLNYGDKGGTLSLNGAYASDLSMIDINAKATTTMEKLKNIDFHLSHQKKPEKSYRQTDATLQLDDSKYTLNTEIQEIKTAPLIHITYTSPSGVTELLSKFQKLGDSDYTGEWKIETPVGFVTADARVNLESIDNFLINVNLDSDKLKERKIHAEITNKPTAKTGRRIIVTVTSDGKNLVTGSTNYKKREEGDKIIVEGNGSLKIGENVRSSSFKYTRQKLTHETDGEVGVAIVLNANFGPSAIVGEIKLTNKELHVFNSFCEQNKDCAHFKLQTTLDTDKKTYIKQQQTVEFDLRKFNIPAEFGLQISTQYTNDMFDHTASLYMHSSKDKSQYTYQLYINPKEAAAILTLPSRELALITTLDLPKNKPIGSYKLILSLFLDRKNNPSEKTSLVINGDVNIDKSSLSINGETKFTYPSQTKDMVVKGKLHSSNQNLLDANVDIDIFAKKSQKINVIAKIVRLPIQQGYNITGLFEVLSKGQQLKIEHKAHLTLSTNEIGAGSILSYTDINQKPRSTIQLFSVNFNEAHLLITVPSKEIIRSDVKVEFSKTLQKVEIENNILDRKPIVTSIEINNFNNFKYVTYEKGNPINKLITNGRVVYGELAEIHSNFYRNGEKKNLFYILVHLDENKFLKPDFEYNKDNIEYLADYSKNQILDIAKEMKKVTADTGKEIVTEFKDLLEHSKKAQPNLKPLLDYYSGELNKFKNELNADQTIQEIQANLNKRFGSFIKAANEIIQKLIEQFNELSKQYNIIISKLIEAIEVIYPRIKESYNKILNAFVEILNATANLATTYLKAILNVINDHQKEIKELVIIGTELFQGIAKVLFKAAEQLKKDINEFVTLLINQAKALPIYEIVKEKYNQINFEIPETIIEFIENFCNTIKAGLPTIELKNLLSSICNYVMMIIKRQEPDNVNQLKKIYTEGIAALKSLIGLIETPSLYYNWKNIFETNIPINLGILAKLPGITTLKLSVLNVLQNGELPTPLDIYYTYKPTRYLNDIVPPFSKTGIVIDEGHIFTFDGNHLTLPGTCNYILVQDMQDGNFSVVGTFQNGVLVSVTVTEPKESITLKNNGNILVNNKPADYPANTKNLHAFLIKPIVNVKSNYGVHVICNGKAPMICIVRVSGFYHGKLRGLLGDGNNEQYDDYTLPSGKITQDASEFGNSYKLKGDCPAVTAVKPSAPTPICAEYFTSSSSPLSNCFKYVDPKNYQIACDQVVSAGTSKEKQCLIAMGYYAACYERNVFGISIPDSCVSCKVGANSLTVGENFSVKLPKKEADIIIIVEETVQNEKIFKNLIVPLMSELREELKQRSITDVHIGLVGFGEHLNWPYYYTTNGNTNIMDEVKNIKFEGENPILSLSEAIQGNITKKIKYLEQRYDVEFGTFKLTEAYEHAINYQFRPEAVKAVIGVITTPCEKSPLPISLQQLRLFLGRKVYHDLGLEYYHVSFLDDILISGKPQKNIVGYDYDSAYTFSDSKKRPMEGSNDLKNNLVLSTSDVCADFAVSSGGAAFSSSNFLEAKPNQRKQFVQVVARRITNGLVNTEIEEDCVCKQSYRTFARLHCKVVNKREKEPLTRHTKGGVKG